MKNLFKNKHPIIFLNFIPRVFGQFLVCVVFFSEIYDRDYSHISYIFLILEGLVWPYFTLFISYYSMDPKAIELKFLLIDALFVGAWIGYLGYPLWPLVSTLTAVTLACLSVNGLTLGFLCLISYAIGATITGYFNGFELNQQTTLLTNIICIICLFTFSTIMGFLTYLRSKSSKQTRAKLRDALNELDHINKILQESSSTLKLDTVTKILIDSLLKNVFKFDVMAFQALETDTKKLVYKIIYDPSSIISDEIKSLEFDLNEPSLASDVFNNQTYQYLKNIEIDNSYKYDIKICSSCNAKSCLVFPVIIKSYVIGIINIYSVEPLKLDQRIIDTTHNYIKQISLIINNAILYEQVKAKRLEISQKNMQLESISKHLAKYIPPQLFDKIMNGEVDINISAKKKFLTIFFSDIVTFTEISDRMESEKLTIMLNIYLDSMTKIALKYGGTIDKYIGDSVMVFFGDPNSSGMQEDASKCALMAIEMNKAVTDLKSQWKSLGIEEDLRIRMGIHTGYCAVGNFGSEFRMDYTVIGSAVNLASRLMTSAEPDEIIISDATYLLIKEVIPSKKRGLIRVKGFAEPIKSHIIITGQFEKNGKISEDSLQANR